VLRYKETCIFGAVGVRSIDNGKAHEDAFFLSRPMKRLARLAHKAANAFTLCS
jgi:hypothetical protein